jgi:hypothetical protein
LDAGRPGPDWGDLAPAVRRVLAGVVSDGTPSLPPEMPPLEAAPPEIPPRVPPLEVVLFEVLPPRIPPLEVIPLETPLLEVLPPEVMPPRVPLGRRPP